MPIDPSPCAPDASFIFETFDSQGAGNGGNQGTFPQSINAAGSITGYSIDAGLTYHGFVRMADGTMVMIDVPGAGSGARQGTTPKSINRDGAVTGYYADSAGATRGFVRTPDGAFETFPVAKGSEDPFTFPNCINDGGVVVGLTNDSSGNGVGFLRAADGLITTLDFPSQAWSVNAAGAVAITGGVQGGEVFLRKPSGDLTSYKVPGVSFAAVNDAGTIMGRYAVAQTYHGFLLPSNGTVIPFDAPGAGPAGTTASAINNDAFITGYYVDTSNVNHGFLRLPSGAIVIFDVPHTAGTYGTFAIGINAAGAVTGYYYDANLAAHGFAFIRCHARFQKVYLIDERAFDAGPAN